ncbi:MAG: peptidylprolyl isomerase [Micrococcales bacterium]|nr:peptidylprolyl isomerase [Micrococcales bacterium]
MRATIHTSSGEINLELFEASAPETVANFVGLADGSKPWTDPDTGLLAERPLFPGTVFHRVISGFMIQGGDPLGNGTGGPGYDFDDEIDPQLNFSQPYVLAMANAGLRGGRGTNGSQFFITVGPTPHLFGKHTIFGQVSDEASQAVVDKIASSPTDGRDRPLDDVMIEAVDIIP